MKKLIQVFSLTLACSLVTFAQTAATRTNGEASNQTSASASGSNKNVNIGAGARLAAQLQSTLDVRKARVGDQVVLKTTNAIKSGGREVVRKGALLVGHITSVEQKTNATGASQVGLVFDRLQNGQLSMPITATITSITRTQTQTQASDDRIDSQSTAMSGASTSTQRSSSGSSGGGGLLGGATNTVGGVVNGATSAVGSTMSSTTGVAGQTTSGLGQSLGHIQISESSSTSVQGGSTLSLQGDNLHLEKGTTFNLVVNQSASSGPQQ